MLILTINANPLSYYRGEIMAGQKLNVFPFSITRTRTHTPNLKAKSHSHREWRTIMDDVKNRN